MYDYALLRRLKSCDKIWFFDEVNKMIIELREYYLKPQVTLLQGTPESPIK